MAYVTDAAAQLTGTFSIVSDYEFRGVSLSQQKSAAQGSIGYDDPTGWYAGVFGSTVRVAGDSATTVQALAYVGAVTPVGRGYHWDMGAAYSGFSATRDYNYGEIYTAITTADYNARIHYSPDYFGSARSSFYVEVNATHSLGNGLALLGHVGVLAPVGHRNGPSPNAVRNPIDARAGLVLAVAGFNIEFAWVGTNGNGALYPINGTQRRNTALASVSRSF
jgi:uncharacterized protein (TIGR02001 family)